MAKNNTTTKDGLIQNNKDKTNTKGIIYPLKGSGKSKFTNVDETQFQQHCIETTCDKLFQIHGPITIGEGFKQFPKFDEMETQRDEKGEYWMLRPNMAYNFESNVSVEVAVDECFFLIQRSSFNRVGIRITSGLYDSGYKGGVNGVIYTSQNPLKLYKGTRIAQILLHSAETFKLYDGQYQGASITNGAYNKQ